ncbi:uncharacterized protein LOC124817936 isoform X1 [Hydra vulgaris]|uniref:uncharacterized protein LOC124817936 isoform X1 n=1 Tax=Hydra vulgaris TaxID=6087 RepID=UPI0032E9F8D7
MAVSLSVRKRTQGNDIFKSISDGLAPVLKETRLSDALKLYQEAINSATCYEERNSAYKNHGVTALNLFKYKFTYLGQMKNHYVHSTFICKFAKAVSFFLLKTRSINQTNGYIHIIQKSIEAIELYINSFLFEKEYSLQISSLNELIQHDKILKIVKVHVTYRLSNLHHQISIKYLDEKQINESFKSINDCNYFYEECFRYNKQVYAENIDVEFNFWSDLDQLKTSIDLQICILDGLKAKHEADLTYDKCINESESVDIELAWNAIDMYRVAIKATATKDIELEAEITSIIGVIYEKILLIKERAKQYYMHALDLAESMKPKLFTAEAWYIRAVNAINKFQKEVVDEEEKAKEVEKEKVISKIKEDLNKIRENSTKSNKHFLIFIYENYPPKDSDHKLDKNVMEKKNDWCLKEEYKKSLIHYHPDKNKGETYGMEWFFIVDEISKHLGRIYNIMKSS